MILSATRFLAALLLLSLSGLTFARAAEFFVTTKGSDSGDGLSRATAFASVQKGIDALKPGDTLTIGPGEYFGAVSREGLGGPDKDTVIRAEIPGTVLLRGDVPAPAFSKVEGYEYVYVADFKGGVQAVNEIDTMKAFTPPVSSIADLEFTAGNHYFYDAKNEKLYISSSDFRPPGEHNYSVGVTPQSGIALTRPTRVTLEGLVATGFNISTIKPLKPEDQEGTVWGFWLDRPKDCVVRNCTVFLNGGGIGVYNDRKSADRGNTLVEGCVAYGNGSPFVSSGGVLIYFANNDAIRNCYAYQTEKYAFRFYQRGNGNALMDGNIATSGELSIKGNPLPEMCRTINCVGLENMDSPSLMNSILGADNRRAATEKDPSTIFLGEEKDLNRDEEFADAKNADFRLQATSRFRAGKAKGKDRGPSAYQANIYYVKPSGDDKADGLSMAHAWKTFDRAAKALKAGDTLYLEGGVYESNVTVSITGSAKEKTYIRGRGDSLVAIVGDFRVEGSKGLVLERLQFSNEVAVRSSEDIAFSDCLFKGATGGMVARGTRGLRVEHSVFASSEKYGMSLSECQAVFLSGNIYDNRSAAAVSAAKLSEVRYSDFNSYADEAKAWDVGGKRISLPTLKADHDEHSLILKPELIESGGFTRVGNERLFAGKGPLGTAIGFYRHEREKALRMGGPVVHSVSATTANIEWQATGSATCVVAWGPTPECANEQTVSIDSFGALSLTDLKPATTYYFQIRSIKSPDVLLATKKQTPKNINTQPISFTTAKADAAPRTYHVSAGGNDENSGLDQKNAWRTINHAASRVNVGDTVLVAAGEYAETVRIRATGTKDAPIRFQSAPGEKVSVTGAGKQLTPLFLLQGKNHLRFDGFYLRDVNMIGGPSAFPPSQSAVFNVAGSTDVQITRCFYDGRGGYSPAFVVAMEAPEMLIKNCVVISAMHGLYFQFSPDLRLENNVFIRCQIGTLHASHPSNERMIIKNNIFTDSLAYKPNGTVMEVPGGTTIEGNNCFFLRLGEDRKAIRLSNAGNADEGGSTFTYRQAAEVFKPEMRSVVKDPQLAILQKLSDAEVAGLKEMNARPDNISKGRVYYPIDLLIDGDGKVLDFADLFATDSEVAARGIGLQPEAFQNPAH